MQIGLEDLIKGQLPIFAHLYVKIHMEKQETEYRGPLECRSGISGYDINRK
jgi:hypothetical protein